MLVSNLSPLILGILISPAAAWTLSYSLDPVQYADCQNTQLWGGILYTISFSTKDDLQLTSYDPGSVATGVWVTNYLVTTYQADEFGTFQFCMSNPNQVAVDVELSIVPKSKNCEIENCNPRGGHDTS